MLKFNSFRSRRYLRSRFIEGKFLLASEGTDLELELLDQCRRNLEKTLGDIFVADAWKVERVSATQIRVKAGEAWNKGLPFIMRSGKDELVSGSVLVAGTVPAGVVISDDSAGNGKLVTFNSGSTTPTDLYRIVLEAREEVITSAEDPFLQNANLTETTAQKIRITVRINVVPESDQTETPLPYTNDGADQNLTNQIIVSPTPAGNGELLLITPVTGSEKIDGRDLELTIRNDSGIGGGNPIPNGNTDQAVFQNGKLIDSTGTEFHITDVFNDTVSTQVIIRLDKEHNQPNPVLTNGSTYKLVKRDVYATDNLNGNPLGKLFYKVANVDWDSVDGIVHDSKITDLRERVLTESNFEDIVNEKYDLKLTGGGTVDFDITDSLLTWSSAFKIINPHGTSMTVAAASAVLVDEGCLAYELDLESGGAIQRGTLGVTVSSAGATSQLASVSLANVRLGNIVVDSGGVIAIITAIDDVNDTITTDIPLVNTGAATIYLDSFGPGLAPLNELSIVTAVRNGNQIWLESGVILDTSASQNLNLKLIAGGIWSWTLATEELSFASDAYIQVPGLSNSRNTILVSASPISLPNDGDVAYVEINRDSGIAANLTVNVSAIASLMPTPYTVIIARRYGNDVYVGTKSILLRDREACLLDGVLNELNNHFDLVRPSSQIPPSVTVDLSDSFSELADGTNLIMPFGQLTVDYAGGSIDFDAGTITGGGDPFTGAGTLLASSQEAFFSINLLDDNTIKVLPGSPASIGSATFADWDPTALPIGQVLVEKNGGGVVQNITQDRIYRPSASGSGGSASTPTGFADNEPVLSGVTSTVITFPTPLANTNYVAEAQFINTTDASPDFQEIIITNKTINGFTVSWNAPTDTANYSLDYIVPAVQEQSGEQVVGLAADNFVVTLPIALPGTNYAVLAQFVNLVDGAPQFQPVVVTAKTLSTFTAKWNGPTDSANYRLAFRVAEYQ